MSLNRGTVYPFFKNIFPCLFVYSGDSVEEVLLQNSQTIHLRTFVKQYISCTDQRRFNVHFQRLFSCSSQCNRQSPISEGTAFALECDSYIDLATLTLWCYRIPKVTLAQFNGWY